MPFDVAGARAAGYSDAEIASFLGSQSGFDVDGAVKAGYQPAEIVGFLSDIKDRGPIPKGDPVTRVEPSAPSGSNTTFAATPMDEGAGAGRGKINPQFVNTETVGQTANRLDKNITGSVISGVREMAGSAGIATMAPAKAIDFVHGLISGKDETGAQDYAGRTFIDPNFTAAEQWAPKEEDETHIAGKVLNGLARMAPTFAVALASGGANATEQATMGMEAVRQAIANGMRSMSVPAFSSGIARAADLVRKGAPIEEAVTAGLTEGATTDITGGLAMSTPGAGAAKRFIQGAAVGATTGDVARQAQNLAAPDFQTERTPEGVAISAATGGILAAGMPHPAESRFGRPEPVREAEVEPVREPARDPIAKVTEAKSVDEAIAAAQEAVSKPVAPDLGKATDVADELLKIRPLKKAEAPEIRPESIDASNDVEAGRAVLPSVEGRGADVAGGEPAGGLGDRGLGAAAEPVRSGGPDVAVEPARGEPAAVAPDNVWMGRSGEGYKTEADATIALPTREKIAPDLTWKIEQMASGRYRLAGYREADAAAPTQSEPALRSDIGNLAKAQQAAGESFTDATPDVHRAEAARIDAAANEMAALPEIQSQYQALAASHRAAADMKESVAMPDQVAPTEVKFAPKLPAEQAASDIRQSAAKLEEQKVPAVEPNPKQPTERERIEAQREAAADRRAAEQAGRQERVAAEVAKAKGAIEKMPEQQALFDIPRQATKTPEFRKWFGGSKVVDEKGEPLVVYHGTGRDFSTFSTEGRKYLNGLRTAGAVWFTPDPKQASWSAENLPKMRGESDAFPNVMPVHLALKNPLIIKDHGELADFGHSLFHSFGAYPTEAHRNALRESGFDGVIVSRTGRAQDASEILAFSPEQIKSATGNRGTFDAADPNILHDFTKSGGVMERIAQQGYEKAEVPRVQAARRLRTLLERYDNNKISDGMFQLQLKMLAHQMADVSATKQANRVFSERERGADLVREKLIRARRQGDLDHGTVEFGLWLLDKNPNLAEGLGASVRTAKSGGTAGRYNPAERVITLFKNKANDGTAVHEILHHSERMMPEEVQRGIAGAWSKDFSKAYKDATPEQRAALDKMAEAMAGDGEAHKDVIRAFRDGTLKYDEHYQLTNPSEYWAVNATRIMQGRFEAKSWVGKAKQWLGEMVEKAKGAFGLSSDAPIIKGLKAVLEGDGTFVSKKMLAKADLLNDRVADVTDKPEEERKPYTGPGSKLVESTKDVLGKVVNDALLSTAPMSTGSEAARAVAKDYANAERLARWQWTKFDTLLKSKFSEAQRKAMWEAADEQNVLLQQGKDTAGKGLDRLPAAQRKVMDTLHDYGEQLLQRAKDVGMFKGEGLPYWTPRMAVMIGADGEYSRPGGEGKAASSDGRGRNVTTSASSLKERKYLTAEETEAAMKGKLGEGATLVRDIRTMPLAMARLERAIAGRELVNQIKDLGKRLGTETVSPTAGPQFFTLDHPAFMQYRPRFTEVDGKMKPVLDQNGEMVFDKTPLFISKDFEGPLKAILTEPSGEAYKAMMALKGKAMGLIMYSPLIHNAVEWGRALPIMPGKVLTFQIYFAGNKIKNDPLQMAQAIKDGMVPIGHRGNIQDITGLMEDPSLAPGRSWTAKLLGGAVGAVNENAGTAVKKGVDAAGDFWHNTLLWDRVGDLQAGLYGAVKSDLIKKGMDEETAGRISAHFANRYAGALPNEVMSATARKIANFVLFSRSFTIGNIGVMKDMVRGLPPDVAAQIKRDSGEMALKAGKSVARRKAVAAFGLDIALLYAGNALLQSAFDVLKRDKTLSEVEQGYVDRFHELIAKTKEHPLDVLSSPLESLSSLTPNSRNEPGKEDRILYGTEDNGTNIYMRMPTGKIGEEFKNWMTSPLDTLLRKQGTFMRPITQTIENDKGFGRRVYNPDDKSWAGLARNVGRVVWNFMSQQLPVDSIQAGVDWAHGHADETDKMKVVGPLAGLTFSKGAPGGPEVGEMYRENKIQQGKIADVMPDVRHAIKVGDTDTAIELMESVNMTPAEIRRVIKKQADPASRLSPGALKNYNKRASEESKTRMQNYGR